MVEHEKNQATVTAPIHLLCPSVAERIIRQPGAMNITSAPR